MSKPVLHFAKIVSSATDNAWSQAYSAGKVAAVVSLSSSEEKEDKEQSLAVIGKDILNTFEAEYFTLESKTLETIKEAVSTTVNKIPKEINATVIVASVVNNMLYAYLSGKGKVLLRRGKQIGTILQAKDEDQALRASSGLLEYGDLVFLATDEFIEAISSELINEIINTTSPTEIAETFSPKIRHLGKSQATAVFFSYEEEPSAKLSEQISQEEPRIDDNKPESNEGEIIPSPARQKPQLRISLPHIRIKKRQTVFLAIAIIITILLAGSIIMTTRKQHQNEQAKLFQSTYTPALSKYNEAESLMALDRKTANDDLTTAQSSLQSIQDRFSQNTKERSDIDSLLNKVNDALSTLAQSKSVPATQVDNNSSPLLAAEIKYSSEHYFAEDDKNIYYADSDGVTQVSRSSGKTKSIITNGTDWSDIGGFSVYFGNVYILDKKTNQILKYTSGASGFGKSNYFSGDHPDITKANAITIDGSIWIVTDDGNILKFTKGKQDSLSLSGLGKPLSRPTQIFTSIDATNVYILDKGNGRIAVFDKNGKFQTDYPADILAKAQDFAVSEKDKIIYILSDGKAWKIDMK